MVYIRQLCLLLLNIFLFLLLVDCEVSSWQPDAECTVTIGIGEQVFTRYITVQPVGTGEPCPELSHVVPCYIPPCPGKTFL